MKTELRKTGISVIGDVRWGTHFCYFYETKQDLLDTLVLYFKAGLENKEFCLWVVSQPLTVEEAKRALSQAVSDLDRHLAKGSLEIQGNDEWYLHNGQYEPERVIQGWRKKLNQALAIGFAGMRASGDTTWVQKEHWSVFREYEKELDALSKDQRMIVLCTYPLTARPDAQICDVARLHQVAAARRHGTWEMVETPELRQTKAEIKRLNDELQRVIARTPKPIPILSFGVAVLSVTAALIISWSLDIHLVTAPVSLLLCAVMFSTWYGGVKPGLLATALSLLAFKYFFVTPIHSLVLEIHEIPRFLIFALAALFAVSLSIAQRSATESLRRARDVLDGTVQELRQTNESLQMENAERRRAEEALKNSYGQLRALSGRLQSVREEEATRISREIHDELGQKLTGLKMDLRRAERKLEGLEGSPTINSLLDTLVSATELADGITAAVQEIAANLRPGVLDKLGLGAALHYEGRRFQERTGIACEVSLPETEPDFSTELSTALFRIFQECLTNVTRHAHATKLEVALKLEDGWVTLRVQDNGRGITEAEIANPESLGLLGMKERTTLLGGEIVFRHDTQGGTIVTVRIPQSGTSVQTKGPV